MTGKGKIALFTPKIKSLGGSELGWSRTAWVFSLKKRYFTFFPSRYCSVTDKEKRLRCLLELMKPGVLERMKV